MGLFDFLKKKDPVQDYLDGFFKNLVIVDVVGAPEIPTLKVNGNLQEASADMYFKDYRIPPYCIDKFTQDNDAIFWIFETYFVFELNATKSKGKMFVVMELAESKNKKIDHQEFESYLYAMELTIKLGELRQQ
ncbi:MAG: hypothetical protein CVU27_01175, partial [Betaproteobacteria bacterium HGW-Betaproteobacteria-20]